MSYHISTIEQIEPQVRPGDIFAFSGRGLVSAIVRCVTGSIVSHVGIVLRAAPGARLVESTSLNGFSGVTEGSLVARCAEYDGSIWWLPLRTDLRARCNRLAIANWLQEREHQQYDTWGAVESALRLAHVDLGSRWYCSELAFEALQAAGVIDPKQPSDSVLPCDLCGLSAFSGDYWQLKGTPETIKEYRVG